MNSEWSQKLDMALIEQEAKFNSENEKSQQMFRAMQQQLAQSQASFESEQQKRMSLEEEIKKLREEKAAVEAEKNTNISELEKLRQTVESLRASVGTAQSTPGSAPESSASRSNFSLGLRGVASSQPTLPNPTLRSKTNGFGGRSLGGFGGFGRRQENSSPARMDSPQRTGGFGLGQRQQQQSQSQQQQPVMTQPATAQPVMREPAQRPSPMFPQSQTVQSSNFTKTQPQRFNQPPVLTSSGLGGGKPVQLGQSNAFLTNRNHAAPAQPQQPLQPDQSRSRKASAQEDFIRNMAQRVKAKRKFA